MLIIVNILFLTLFSIINSINKLYGIEHYISISSGLSLNNSKFEQHILESSLHKVNKKQNDYCLAKKEYSSNIWKFTGNSPKFSLEYLAYLKGVNIGIGLDTYNPKITSTVKNSINYNRDIKVKLREYNIQPYAIILINTFNNKFFNLKLGTQFGVNYLRIERHYSNILTNGKNTKQISFIPQLVAESEFKLSNKIAVFTRVNLSIINSLKDTIKYDNKLFIKEENNNNLVKSQRPYKLVNTSINSFIKYQNGSTYSINFGLRYKL